MNDQQSQSNAYVYEGNRIVGTFSCRESAAAFIRSEYSAAEADILDVRIVSDGEESEL